MGLDIRMPIGGMFVITGLLLAAYGILTGSDSALYEKSLSVNINLWWGMAMLAFGAVMLFFGLRSPAKEGVHLTEDSPEGRATEEREHRMGLERDRH